MFISILARRQVLIVVCDRRPADSFAALLTLYAITVAERPADQGHQYGHGKAQHLGALAEALLLVGAAIWIAIEAVGRLQTPGEGPHSTGIGIALMLFVLAIDASRATVAGRTVEWDDDNSCWYTSFKEAMSGALIEHHKRRVRYPR